MIKRVLVEIRWWLEYIKIFLKSLFNKNAFLLLGTPLHGNLGDQAIALAEYYFLNDYFPDKEILEIPSQYFVRHSKLYKFVIGKRDILVHGGGFLGTLWMEEEKMFRKILTTFPQNRIIVLPQTVYFGEEKWEKDEFVKSKEIYNYASNLIICTREKYSYDFFEREMKDIVHILIPDMVLYLKKNIENRKKTNVLLCMRSDKEKLLSMEDGSHIYNTIEKVYGKNQIIVTDTVVNYTVTKRARKKEVETILQKFADSELIITDRLHGMVLAAIAGTPCIVFGNCNYKVKGVYEWIKNNDYVIFVESADDLENRVEKMRKKIECVYDNAIVLKKFEELVGLIDGGVL